MEGEFQYTWTLLGTPVAGQIQPQIKLGEILSLSQYLGGSSDSPVADVVYAPAWPALSITPPAGLINVTLTASSAGAPYVYADGQEIAFYHNGQNGRVIRFPVGGALLGLTQDRCLVNKGDVLRLRYNLAANLWEEAYFSSSANAQAPVALVDGVTIPVEFGFSRNSFVTLAGNRTLANPTNAQPGQKGLIRITQDATGTRTLAYGTNWRFAGGAAVGGVLTTTAGAVDVIDYEVGDDGKIYARLAKAFAA